MVQYAAKYLHHVSAHFICSQFIHACHRCSNPQSKVYSVPVGGMSVVGEWGYIEAFREMMEQVSGCTDQRTVLCAAVVLVEQYQGYFLMSIFRAHVHVQYMYKLLLSPIDEFDCLKYFSP